MSEKLPINHRQRAHENASRERVFRPLPIKSVALRQRGLTDQKLYLYNVSVTF